MLSIISVNDHNTLEPKSNHHFSQQNLTSVKQDFNKKVLQLHKVIRRNSAKKPQREHLKQSSIATSTNQESPDNCDYIPKIIQPELTPWKKHWRSKTECKFHDSVMLKSISTKFRHGELENDNQTEVAEESTEWPSKKIQRIKNEPKIHCPSLSKKHFFSDLTTMNVEQNNNHTCQTCEVQKTNQRTWKKLRRSKTEPQFHSSLIQQFPRISIKAKEEPKDNLKNAEVVLKPKNQAPWRKLQRRKTEPQFICSHFPSMSTKANEELVKTTETILKPKHQLPWRKLKRRKTEPFTHNSSMPRQITSKLVRSRSFPGKDCKKMVVVEKVVYYEEEDTVIVDGFLTTDLCSTEL